MFLFQESEVDDEEEAEKAALKLKKERVKMVQEFKHAELMQKGREILAAILLNITETVSPLFSLIFWIEFIGIVFWVAIIWLSTKLSKYLLYLAAINEHWWISFLLKIVVISILAFDIVVIFTWFKESRIWQKIKLLFKKKETKPFPYRRWKSSI